jgi:DNA-binding GntR family transcriptional regulator
LTQLYDDQAVDPDGTGHAADSSLVDQAYSKILMLLSKRGTITSERLNITRLAETLDISRTPVSMALMRLEGEGLVRRTEDQTWVTTRLSLDDLKDIFDIKELLDPFVAREAAGRITPDSAQALLAAAADMLDAAESGDADRWIASDRQYHAILLRVAGNQELERILRDFSRKLHQLKTINSVIKRRMVVASSDHQDLAQAVAIGDRESAAECALRDVRNLREAVMDVMENVLLPFLGERFSP